MPNVPLRPCPVPHCAALTRGGLCAVHAQHRRQRDYERRGSAQERGYTYRWNLLSHNHLEKYPLCGMKAHDAYEGWRGECHEQGKVTPAEVTDHIIPHKGDQRLFWDPKNRQALCHHCNRLKAIRYEGGFGMTPVDGR